MFVPGVLFAVGLSHSLHPLQPESQRTYTAAVSSQMRVQRAYTQQSAESTENIHTSVSGEDSEQTHHLAESADYKRNSQPRLQRANRTVSGDLVQTTKRTVS